LVLDERDLVRRLQAGDRRAFRDLVDRYQRDVYGLACDLCGNHHDAEDLSQDVFIKAFRAIGGFRADARLGSWLYRITMNAHIDKHRRKPVSVVSIDAPSAPGGDEGRPVVLPAADGRDPDQSARARRFQQDVDRALDALTPQERTVFVLRHYNDMRIREISDSLSIAEGTVKSLLFRSVRKLRDRLSDYQGEVGDLA
jgi:RNA polymerase sigma-70 factor (ECF subfamily)